MAKSAFVLLIVAATCGVCGACGGGHSQPGAGDGDADGDADGDVDGDVDADADADADADSGPPDSGEPGDARPDADDDGGSADSGGGCPPGDAGPDGGTDTPRPGAGHVVILSPYGEAPDPGIATARLSFPAADGERLDVGAFFEDDGSDDFDTSLFVHHVAVAHRQRECRAWDDSRDTDGDGFDDAYLGVDLCRPLCWDIGINQNDIIEHDLEPAVFGGTVVAIDLASGEELNRRQIYFLVPPRDFEPPP